MIHETAAAARIIAELDCDEAHGYYFARPMELSSFERWLVYRDAVSVAA